MGLQSEIETVGMWLRAYEVTDGQLFALFVLLVGLVCIWLERFRPVEEERGSSYSDPGRPRQRVDLAARLRDQSGCRPRVGDGDHGRRSLATQMRLVRGDDAGGQAVEPPDAVRVRLAPLDPNSCYATTSLARPAEERVGK